MDYPTLVRTALTWPSGQLKGDVSAYEYSMWMRSAYSGGLAEIYENYPVSQLGIYNMAASNTRVQRRKVQSHEK